MSQLTQPRSGRRGMTREDCRHVTSGPFLTAGGIAHVGVPVCASIRKDMKKPEPGGEHR